MTETMKVRLSAGTAAVAGLNTLRQRTAPQTAYLLVGGACAGQCAFCPQAETSQGPSDFLSRISWPQFPWTQARQALVGAIQKGRFRRVCLQVTQNPDSDSLLESLIRSLAKLGVPISMSRSPEGVVDVEKWAGLGIERMGLPIDAATAPIYKRIKGGRWEQALDGLEKAARLLPGRVSTHLIVGLGESEEEAVAFLKNMVGLNVNVGLFALTPIKGTPLAETPQPPLGSYRRIQVARHLLAHGIGSGDFLFSQNRLVDFGMDQADLGRILESGEAFMTTGCPECNRPYYNERPRGDMYNYPHRLDGDEVKACLLQMSQ